MMIILLSVAGVIFAFGIVIFVHEFGHFIVAKKSGVKVERFSFGLGPELIGFQWGETRYCIAWLPLGGEVRMAGEFPTGDKDEREPQTEETPRDRSREFFAQPWYRRVAIALAGPSMNYVLAVLIFFGMLVVWGDQIQVNKTEVGEAITGMPAEKAGIKTGDKVLKVDGEDVNDFPTLAQKIHGRPGQETELLVLRDGQEFTVKVVPIKDPDKNIGLIGIKPAAPVTERVQPSVAQAAKKAVWQCWNISVFTVYYLAQKIWARERPDVAGPIGIGQVIVKAVKSGAEDFFYLIGLISTAIGLFNLFPIPLLDGGHVLYYMVEGIRGRPLSQKAMSRANAVGLALLLSLLVFATMNDLQRLRSQPDKSAAGQRAP